MVSRLGILMMAFAVFLMVGNSVGFVSPVAAMQEPTAIETHDWLEWYALDSSGTWATWSMCVLAGVRQGLSGTEMGIRATKL